MECLYVVLFTQFTVWECYVVPGNVTAADAAAVTSGNFKLENYLGENLQVIFEKLSDFIDW